GVLDRRERERAAEARAPRRGPHVQPLHLADAVREGAHADATGVARDEEDVVAIRQRGELVLESLERQIDAERLRILAEERPDELDVLGYRNLRSSARSFCFGSHDPAFAFARTCSGFVAPAITDVIAGIAIRPPIATS